MSLRFGWNIVRGIRRVLYDEGPAASPPGPVGWNITRGIPRVIFGRGFPRPTAAAGGGVIVPGLASIIQIGRHSFATIATAPTGGTPPYRYQWQYLWARESNEWIDATGQNVTTLAAVIMNLGPDALYLIRLQITDSAGAVQYSNVLTAWTQNLRWFPGLARKNRRR